MEITSDSVSGWLKELQDSICSALVQADGKSSFEEDNWLRAEGGGGRTRVLKDGNVIEKGGVLFSAVHGDLPDFLLKEKNHSSIREGTSKKQQFFATGVSIVIHPQNPMVPIIHMNIRYFEMDNGTRWLGGGIDLTPHYIHEADARFFHSQLKTVCDRHHPGYYSKFRNWADDYFYIPHRQETRGIGGIFFDHLDRDEHMDFEANFNFWKDVGLSFAPIYTELIARNKNKSFDETNKRWQLLRRGRYVEFNLVYDKGTKFGLETNGRIESILVSLPSLAGWEYNFTPEKNSEEEKTQGLLKKGLRWT